MTKPIWVTRQQIEDAVRLLNKYGHLSDKTVIIRALNELLDGHHHLVMESEKEAAGMKLKNNLMANLSLDETAILLADRLLWLRNHYDTGDRTSMMKRRVLADIDTVLGHVGLPPGGKPEDIDDDEKDD